MSNRKGNNTFDNSVVQRGTIVMKLLQMSVSRHPGNRFYRACSFSGSDGETDSSPTRPVRASRPRRNNIQQHTYHLPAGLSDSSPNSDNVSNATLTDSEIALGRDTTLLAHKNFKYTIHEYVRAVRLRSNIQYMFVFP
ncbi:hypothetical protein PGB90_010032 [Kerria lacca]